jgi:hypothetical protein
MADQEEIDAAFERGRRVGQLEGSTFAGISPSGLLPGAEFIFERSYFHSFVRYERALIDNLRYLERLRWSSLGGDLLMPGGHDPNQLEVEIKDELWRVRGAVDTELEEGRGDGMIIEAMRASPQLPATVLEYSSVEEFIAEDPRRAITGAPQPDLAGSDHGVGWSLENPFRRWETTSWRISWLFDHEVGFSSPDVHSDEGDGTTEVYAAEGRPVESRGFGGGRVWLLGKLRTRAAVGRAVDDLVGAMRERNSLVAAAASVARVEAEEDPAPR